MPASLPGEEGYYNGLYTDVAHEEPLLRITTELLEDKDRKNHALQMGLFNSRARHWATLTHLAPVVQTGYLNMEAMYPVRSPLSNRMDWPDVGGISPPSGPHLPLVVGPWPHPCPFGPQALRDREFPNPHIQLLGHEGNLYEDYYGMPEVVRGSSSMAVVVSSTVLRVLWDMTRCVLSFGGVEK